MNSGIATDSFDRLGNIAISDDSNIVNGSSSFDDIDGGSIYIREGSFVLDSSYLTAESIGANYHGGSIDISIRGGMCLRNRGIISTDFSSGTRGNIRIDAGSLSMDYSVISNDNSGAGTGGQISLNAGSLSLSSGALIRSSSNGTGNAGKMTITSSGAALLSGGSTGLFSYAEGGGNAGDILLNVDNLSLYGGAKIDTNGYGRLNGGKDQCRPKRRSAPKNFFQAGSIQKILSPLFQLGRTGLGKEIDYFLGQDTKTFLHLASQQMRDSFLPAFPSAFIQTFPSAFIQAFPSAFIQALPFPFLGPALHTLSQHASYLLKALYFR